MPKRTPLPTLHDHTTTLASVADLHPHPDNPRQGDVGAIIESIQANGWYGSLVVQRSTGYVLAGNHRLQAAKHLKLDRVPVTYVDVDDLLARRILLADNRANDRASYDNDRLVAMLQQLHADAGSLDGTLFDGDDLDALLTDLGMMPGTGTPADPTPRAPAKLSDRFGAPPFSILDTRQGYWQDRKREWLQLGIQSELGRDAVAIVSQDALNAYQKPKKGRKRGNADSLTNVQGAADAPAWTRNGMQRMVSGTSIFDPVLTELMLRWYSPPAGRILDPFAGGSVRGIISSALGRAYTGVDLRPEQVDANRAQWAELHPHLPDTLTTDHPTPTWHAGDSLDVVPTLDGPYDMLLTCPPYGSLEVYSDDPRDLSTMDSTDFDAAYARILTDAAAQLANDRFAVIVVSEYRDARGAYPGLIPHTVRTMQAAGLDYYSEAALVNAVGTLAIRASAQFAGSRKLLRTHQSVLVFVKGDHKRAAAACTDADAATIDPPDTDGTTGDPDAWEVIPA